ncbi:HIRAN domain-containing protein [Faecalimonas sp.]
MSAIYFTLTGTQYYYSKEFLEPGMHVILEKEPDNEYDKEAIQVRLEGLGCIGYVANSLHTVVGESYSAGRLYDRIGDKAFGKVLYVMPTGVLCKLSKKSLVIKKPEDIQIQIQEEIIDE